MANQELTDLQILTSLASTDLFFVRDISTTLDKQISVSDMAAFFGGGTFLSHSDTPPNYTGAQDKFVKVNGTGTALEFVVDPGYLLDITSELLSDLSDVTVTGTPTGELLAFTGSIWENQTLAEVGIAPAVHTHVEADITDLQDYSLIGHSHVEADITDLQAYLLDITSENIGDLSDVVLTSVVDGELLRFDGSDWINNTLVEAGVAPVSHTHVEANITDLQNYSLVGHQHVEADITDLQAYLLNINSESIDDLSDVDTSTVAPTTGDILQWDNTNWVPVASDTPGLHASTHVSGGGDEIDGDVLDITFAPSNYTRTTAPTEVTTVDELTAHLAGIDTALGTFAPASHTHVEADITDLGTYSVVGHTHVEADITDLQAYVLPTDSVDILADVDTTTVTPTSGDVLSWNGSNWVPASSMAPGAHASTHVSLGSDEIDGDVLDITFVPANYTRLTSPIEVTTVVELTAHLAGIDAELATFAPASHTHVEADITDLGTYSVVGHTHVEADITDLQAYLLNITNENLGDLSDVVLMSEVDGELLRFNGTNWINNTLAEAGVAPASHTHVEADITDLGNYSVVGHTHVEADITDLQAYLLPTDSIDALGDVDTTTSVPSIGEHLQWDGSNWVPGAAGGGGTFISQSDTPANYTGDAGKFLKVTAGADAVEFTNSLGDIGALDDVNISSVVSGELLAFTGTLWENQTLAQVGVSAVGHTHVEADITDLQPYLLNINSLSIDELSDVSTTGGQNTPSIGEHLEWDGTTWIPAPTVVEINDLSDVATSGGNSPSVGEHLEWNGTNWVPATATAATDFLGLTDTPADYIAAGSFFVKVNAGATALEFVADPGFLLNINAESIDDLSDVVITTVASDEILKFDGANWINNTLTEAGVAAASHTHVEANITDLQAYLLDITSENLADLSDVTLTGIVDGELLRFNGTIWINNTLTEAGIAASSHTHVEADITDLQLYLLDITSENLDDLSDVTLVAEADGELLRFNGTIWINNTLTEAGIAAAAHTHVEANITDLQAYLLPADSIDALTDVDTTTSTPSVSDVLAWDGSNWIPATASAPGAHASTHESGAIDPIDGDVLDITFVPTNYTPDTSPGEVTLSTELTAHLAGIDVSIAANSLLPKWDRQIASEEVLTQTTSTTFVDVPGMTLTTKDLGSSQDGSYLVHFTASVGHASTKSSIEFQLLIDGVVVTKSITTLNFQSLFLDTQFSWLEDPIVDAKIIKVQWRQTQTTGSAAGMTASMLDRRLIISGVPSAAVVV